MSVSTIIDSTMSMSLLDDAILLSHRLVGYPPFNDNTTVYERHFYFVCVTYRVTPLIDILIGNDTMDRCAMGAGALTITARRWQQGVIFSYPFFRTGLGVMISSQPVQTVYNPWAFLLPFHWTIWLALAVTLFVVPMLVWLVENLVRTGSIPFHRESFEDIGFAIYTTLLTVFNLEVVSLLTIPAQAIIICFCFLNLVMVATYTANLAAKLTTSVQTVGFQAASDLQGTSVGAHGPYQQRLAVNHNLNTINTTWAGTSTFLDAFGQIHRKEISAYIFDYPILLYWKNFYDTDCQLTFLPEIEPFDYGIMFNRNFPRDIQGEFNVGILIAQGSAKLAQLEAKYVSVSSSCGATSMMGNENTLTFFQVSGLWIILGCAVGLALLFSAYRIVKVHCFGGVIEAFDYDHYEHHSPFRRGLSFRKHFHSESFTQHEISPQGASGPIREGSKALWPGESQLIDPETTIVRVGSLAPSQGEIQKAPSGLPPLYPSPHVAINTSALGGSGSGNNGASSLSQESAARLSNQKTASGPPASGPPAPGPPERGLQERGSMSRSSKLYGTLAASFARVGAAAKDLAGKVLVDPNDSPSVRGQASMQGDFSTRSLRTSARYSPGSCEVGMGEMSVLSGGHQVEESPFDRVPSRVRREHATSPSQGATATATATANSPSVVAASSYRRSSVHCITPLSTSLSGKPPAGPSVDKSTNSISLSLPPSSPTFRQMEARTLPHTDSSERLGFYRPKTDKVNGGDTRLLVNKALVERLNTPSKGSGSKLSNASGQNQ